MLQCVKVKGDGSADWEPGENRVVEVSSVKQICLPHSSEMSCSRSDVYATFLASCTVLSLIELCQSRFRRYQMMKSYC